MLKHLIPSRRNPPGEEPIFALNAEAQKRRAGGEQVVNATLGALTDDAGHLVIHETVRELWKDLTPEETAPYAPLLGDPTYLKAMVQRYWPKLENPGAACATPGGSGALALSARSFLEPGMAILTGAPYWGPYNLFAAEAGCRIVEAPYKTADQPLDLDAWSLAANALMDQQGRLLVWLNDPCQNPTGLSLSHADREGFLEMLARQAARGPVVLLLDSAYLDYTADPAHVRDALDQYAAYAEKGDVLIGAALSISKSMTMYGARGGALAFPWCHDPTLATALGLECRGLWSAAPKAAQSLVIRLAKDGHRQEKLNAELRHWSEVLESRAVALDSALRLEGLAGTTWHGGFFVTLRTEEPTVATENLRTQGVFVVPVGTGIRVGICSLRAADAPRFARALKNLG
ncbi:MAG: pyridoxal phosphate-dependent aminotransferase [Holophaga sp.]|nr:pyridoxal phosphate-dependent aminotransferase [Holophaga sp.]